jgi:hypothetical protein
VRKLLGLLGSLCLLSASCIAESSNTITVPGIKIEIKVEGTGTGWYVVTNENPSAIVAMHFKYGCSPNVQSQVYDVLVSSHPGPISYRQSWKFDFGSTEIPACPGGIDAALFEDGHHEGDADGLAVIYGWRNGILKGIDFALPLLDDVIASEGNQSKALVSIADTSHSSNGDLTRAVSDRVGEWFVLGIVVSSLTKEETGCVPPDRTCRRGATTESVMQTESLNHAGANAFVLKRKLLEWKQALVDEAKLTGQPAL